MSQPTDLERFLVLIPFVASRKRGVPLEELCEHLSIDAAGLLRLVDAFSFVGDPQGSPDELVDMSFEGDRLFVHLPQKFHTPPRFTLEEAIALSLALGPVRHSSLSGLSADASVVTQKLLALMGANAQEASSAIERLQVHADDDDAKLTLLSEAIASEEEVHAVYYSAGRDELTTRTVHPVHLLQVRGIWYCVGSENEPARVYRLDRFRELTATGNHFEATAVDIDAIRSRIEEKTVDDHEVVVELRVEGDDRMRSWKAHSLHNLTRFIRGLRGSATVVGPPRARDAVIRDAAELVSRYGTT